jgi:hypothetical protein
LSKVFLFKEETKMAENKYKDTLNMGQTDFEMRAGLKDKEPNFQKMWAEQKTYNEKIKLNTGKPSFILHDGPPYANGNIHVGHALNKTLKDFIIRWKNATGRNRTPGNVVLGRVRHPETVRRVQVHLERGHSP